MKTYTHLYAATITALLMIGCANSPNSYTNSVIDASTIPEKFATKEVTISNILSETRSCLGSTVQPQSVETIGKDIPIRSGFSVMSNTQSKNYAYFFASSIACIQQTAKGYPILAAEAFNRTIIPIGLPESIKTDWDKKIAARIAATGTARVLYLYSNGNAQSAIFWVKPEDKGFLHYGSDFKRAGQFQPGDYDYQFSHPSITGISTTSYQNGTVFRKGFLQHRVTTSGSLGTGGGDTPTRATPMPK